MFTVLGAAGVTLGLAITGTFIARAKLLEAQAWVRHTSEVEFWIAECRLHLRDGALPDAQAAAQRVQGLTVDNPAQQVRVAALLDRLHAGSTPQSDGLLRDLMGAETALMDVRSGALGRATTVGWLLLIVSASLTLVMILVFVRLVHRQAVSLTRAEATVRQKSAMLESVLESMVEGVMAVTANREVLLYNRSARQMLGKTFPEGHFPKDWRSVLECVQEDGTPLKPEDGALARAISGQVTNDLTYKVRQLSDPHDPGIWISATGRPVVDGDGTLIAGMAVLRDISEQKRHQDELRALSISDELTGLYNRRGFLVLAEQHARVAQRQQASFAIVFADLNGLKTVNDSAGHEAGDRLIRGAAAVMRAVFRESDVLARLGGDEFVTLLANARSEMAETILGRIRNGIAKRNAATDGPPVSFSVGISFFDPQQPASVADLMADADRLMYENKRAGRQQRG